jgi:AbrB family looped-hinge helix DNA binding protein
MARPSLKHTTNSLVIQSAIKQWGNSLGIRIPKEIRNNLNLSDGSKVVISLNKKSKKITIENFKSSKVIHELAKNLNLPDLTKNISKKNIPNKDESFSGIVGREVW